MPKLSLYSLIQMGRIRVNIQSPPEHRFWKSVNKSGPVHPIHGRCWVWTVSVSYNGYGQIVTYGRSNRSNRYSYELHHGPIPDGMQVLHKCDNPGCVNPAHLFLGDTKVNMQDKFTKDRQAKGERNGESKLTDAQAADIKRRYIKGCLVNGQCALAREFGVTQTAVYYLVKGITWNHV